MSTILVIDDHRSARDAMRRVLERAGHLVTTAADGVEGVRVYLQHRPDLVIVDMLMPEKEGVATILDIRAAHPDARVIAISGGGLFVAEDVLRIARLLGADDTLQKPFKSRVLLTAVARCLSDETERAGLAASVTAAALPTTPR
ncbi:MAG TPA: response regulator [Stellaceae bacterium]|nr:response regulator [Stellaceae bacterium]